MRIVVSLAVLVLGACSGAEQGAHKLHEAPTATVLAAAAIPTSSTTVEPLAVTTTATTATPTTLAAPAVTPPPEPDPEPEPEAPQPTNPVGRTPSPAPKPAADTSVGGEIAARMNAERKAAGLAAVSSSGALASIAAAHSADQAVHDTMSHAGSDGATLGQRLSRGGFRASGYAENVAAGYGSADAVMTGWMNSVGHRANILGNYTQVGVALARSASGVPYWTMVLGRP